MIQVWLTWLFQGWLLPVTITVASKTNIASAGKTDETCPDMEVMTQRQSLTNFNLESQIRMIHLKDYVAQSDAIVWQSNASTCVAREAGTH